MRRKRWQKAKGRRQKAEGRRSGESEVGSFFETVILSNPLKADAKDLRRSRLKKNAQPNRGLSDLFRLSYLCNMEISTMPVSFTEGAIAEINRLMSDEGFDRSQFLRVGVKGGGCSGLSYILGFDEKTENDDVFETEDLTFIMNKSHGIYLMGMEIDYQGGLNSRGFTFSNPNASKSCGCGSSFAV